MGSGGSKAKKKKKDTQSADETTEVTPVGRARSKSKGGGHKRTRSRGKSASKRKRSGGRRPSKQAGAAGFSIGDILLPDDDLPPGPPPTTSPPVPTNSIPAGANPAPGAVNRLSKPGTGSKHSGGPGKGLNAGSNHSASVPIGASRSSPKVLSKKTLSTRSPAKALTDGESVAEAVTLASDISSEDRTDTPSVFSFDEERENPGRYGRYEGQDPDDNRSVSPGPSDGSMQTDDVVQLVGAPPPDFPPPPISPGRFTATKDVGKSPSLKTLGQKFKVRPSTTGEGSPASKLPGLFKTQAITTPSVPENPSVKM